MSICPCGTVVFVTQQADSKENLRLDSLNVTLAVNVFSKQSRRMCSGRRMLKEKRTTRSVVIIEIE